jgi:hypothetical protein
MKSFCVLSISITILLGCSNNEQVDCLMKSGIKSNEWKSDKYGCRMYRYNKVHMIDSCKFSLIDRSRNSIIDFFGEPNYTSIEKTGNEALLYIVEPNIFCRDSSFDKNKRISVSTLFFIIDHKKKVIDLGITNP